MWISPRARFCFRICIRTKRLHVNRTNDTYLCLHVKAGESTSCVRNGGGVSRIKDGETTSRVKAGESTSRLKEGESTSRIDSCGSTGTSTHSEGSAMLGITLSRRCSDCSQTAREDQRRTHTNRSDRYQRKSEGNHNQKGKNQRMKNQEWNR